jgi:hypothetical protein
MYDKFSFKNFYYIFLFWITYHKKLRVILQKLTHKAINVSLNNPKSKML